MFVALKHVAQTDAVVAIVLKTARPLAAPRDVVAILALINALLGSFNYNSNSSSYNS